MNDINLAEARRFLDVMAEGEPVTFQCFDDDAKRESKALAWIGHGDLNKLAGALTGYNDSGAGIFWMVNFGDGRGRAGGNVTAVRCLFVDLDGAPLAPVLAAGVEPHAVIESSPGRWHVYWEVTGCSLEQFKPAQTALALKFNGDKSVNDLPRVLRVPGFLHRKGEPFQTRIESLAPLQPYAFDDLVQRLGLDLTAKAPPRVDPETGEITTASGPDVFAAAVKRLGRKLRSGDNRRVMLRTYIASRSSLGVTATDLELMVDGIALRYFDPTDQMDAGNIRNLVKWVAGRDQNALPNFGESDADGVPVLFHDVDLSKLATHAAVLQEWFWQGYMPAGHVTLLGGHGGAGKSTVALMLAACIAVGRDFLGQPTKRARVLYFSGEDPEALTMRRLAKIIRLMGLDPELVRRNLRVIDATEFDPVLFTERRIGGVRAGVTTPTYLALAEYVEEHQIDVLIADNASDVFDGEEINRAMVRAFIRCLARLVRKRNGAALLLSHVDKTTSKAGKFATSESYSGSTAWHNSVRSRLFLMEVERGRLEIQHQKSNLGAKHETLAIDWPEGGLPQLAAVFDRSAGDALAQCHRDTDDTDALLLLIHEFTGRGEFVATVPNSSANAVRLLGNERTYPKRRKGAEVFALLRDAERGGLIERYAYRTADRKAHERWALTTKGCASIGVIAPGAPGAPGSEGGTDSADGAAGAPGAPGAHTGGMGEAARTQPGAKLVPTNGATGAAWAAAA